jgi:CheY-like chemotaxis protein
MPFLDGLALCRTIWADETLKNTPIILSVATTLSTAPTLADVTERKPISVEALVTHIRTLLGRK